MAKSKNIVEFTNHRTTNDTWGHTKVYHNDVYVGYIIKNNSKASKIGENWNFVSKADNLKHCYDVTKTKLIEKVKSQILN